MILKRKQISFHRSVRCGPIEKFVTKIYTLLYHIPYLMPRASKFIKQGVQKLLPSHSHINTIKFLT